MTENYCSTSFFNAWRIWTAGVYSDFHHPTVLASGPVHETGWCKIGLRQA
jgi:hypothetical protein